MVLTATPFIDSLDTAYCPTAFGSKQLKIPTRSGPQPGWYEQDADRIWWGDFQLLCRKLLGNLQYPKESIKGVAVSTIGPCVLPVDKAGKPLRPGILYGIDTRADKEIREIEEKLGREAIFAKTGQDLSSQSCCPKIRWIQKNEPQVWEKTSKVLTATGYLVYKLTGRYTLDIYSAIGFAPIFDLAKKTWDPSLAGFITEMDKLPELLWSTQVAGELTPEAAALTGLPPGVPVHHRHHRCGFGGAGCRRGKNRRHDDDVRQQQFFYLKD